MPVHFSGTYSLGDTSEFDTDITAGSGSIAVDESDPTGFGSGETWCATYKTPAGAASYRAYSRVDAATSPGLGDFLSLTFKMQLGDAAIFSSRGVAVVPSSAQRVIDIKTSGGTGAIALHVTPTVDSVTGNLRFQLLDRIGSNFSPNTTNSIAVKTWADVAIYAKIANGTDGWMQLWINDNKESELTGIDTYPGATLARLEMGQVHLLGQTDHSVSVVYDSISYAELESPSPPGAGISRPKVFASLAGASPLVIGGLVR